MKKYVKKIVLAVLIGLIILSGLPNLTLAQTITPSPSDPKPPQVIGAEEFWVDGIIVKDDYSAHPHPSTVSSAKRLYFSEGEPGRTGFSVEIYKCVPNPVNVDINTWISDGAYRSTDSQKRYTSIDYMDQIVRKYGDKTKGAVGELRVVDYWSIKGGDTRFWPCEIGDEAYHYNDNEIEIGGYLALPIDDPSDDHLAPGRTEGDVSGDAYWELVRHNENARSGVDAYSSLSIAGKHYATRNMTQSLQIGNQSITQEGPISIRIPDGMTVKNGQMTYGLSYEYTNYYRDIYKCTSLQGGSCFEWTFVERVPQWDKVKTFNFTDTVRIDHRIEEVISGDKIEDILNSYLMGRKVAIKSSTQKTNTPYYENFKKNAQNDRKSMTELKTQTSLPITPGKLDYKVTFPSGAHGGNNVLRKEKTYGYYFPTDVDDSLKERYANSTEYNDYDYAFPLQQSTQEGANSNQVWDYDTDLFFMSYALGYMSGYPYADMVKQKVMHGRNLPSYEQLMKDGSEKLEREFIEDWNYGFFDHVLYTDDPSEFWKIQRHQLPVQGDSILHPNELYKNHLVLKNMGLNDLTFRFNQSFSFEHYFIGHGADEPYLMEQVESRPTKFNEYDPSVVHSITITNDQIKQLAAQQAARPKKRIHGFRRIDRDIIEKTEAIVGEFPVGDE